MMHRFAVMAVLLVLSWTRAFAQVPDSVPHQPLLDTRIDDGAVHMIAPMRTMTIVETEYAYSIKGGKVWAADSLQLQQAATGNVTQVLEMVPSMSLKRYAPGGLATPAFRGTGAGHTQVFWEGMPLNSAMLGQQDLALGAGNLFAGVQAYYGGSSLTLGSGGIGGAIALFSGGHMRYPYRRELRLRQQFGSWGNLGSNLEFDISKKQFYSSTRLYTQTGKNNFTFSNTTLPGSPRQQLANAGIFQFGGMQDFNFALKENYFFAKLWVLQSDRSLPPTMVTTDAGESQADQALRGLLGWHRPTRFGLVSVTGGHFMEWMDYRNPTAQLIAVSHATRTIGDALFKFDTPKHRLGITQAGLRYVHDRASTDGYIHGAQQNLVSAMVRGEWKARDERRFLSLLIRQEVYSTNLSPILAYLGGRFKLSSSWNLSSNLARNYRYPTLNDRYWIPGGNPDLKPELSHSAEMNLNWLPRPRRREDNRQSFSVGGYYNHVDDWILWVPGTGAVWHPENVRKVNALGIEANASLVGQTPRRRLQYQLLASYTYNQSRDQDGYQLIYTPQHLAFARLYLKWKSLDLQYFQDWNSRRYTVADNSAFVKGFTTGDLTLGWRRQISTRLDIKPIPTSDGITAIAQGTQFKQGILAVQVGVRNIWNAQFQTVAWRPMPGRSFFVRLEWTLSRGERLL